MTNEARAQLIQNGIDRTENLQRLYDDNMGLWLYTVAPFVGSYEIEDLLQHCFLYLAVGLKTYNAEFPFSTYFVKSIRRKISAEFSNGIRYPQHAIEKRGKIENLKKQGITDPAKQAEILGISRQMIDNINSCVVSYNTGEEVELIDLFRANSNTEAEALFHVGNEYLRENVWEIAGKILKPREVELMRRLHVKGQTLAEIAEDWNCTHQYVSEVKLRAYKKLKKSKKLKCIAQDFDYLTGESHDK